MDAPLLAKLVRWKIHPFLPEKRLMVAVLAVALADYQKHAVMPTSCHFAELQAWFASDDTRWPFSFVAICEALDLDVSGIRAGVRTCRSRRRYPASLR